MKIDEEKVQAFEMGLDAKFAKSQQQWYQSIIKWRIWLYIYIIKWSSIHTIRMAFGCQWSIQPVYTIPPKEYQTDLLADHSLWLRWCAHAKIESMQRISMQQIWLHFVSFIWKHPHWKVEIDPNVRIILVVEHHAKRNSCVEYIIRLFWRHMEMLPEMKNVCWRKC